MELLIQRPGGHIYVATPALEKRKDMYPYEPPAQPEPEATKEPAPEGGDEQAKGTDQTGSKGDPTGSDGDFLDNMSREEMEAYAMETFDWNPNDNWKDETVKNKLRNMITKPS